MRDPHIEVTPLKKATIAQAQIKELSLADIWRRKRVKRDIKKCITDGKLVGHAWLKVGYNGDFKTMVDAEGNQFSSIKKDDFFIYRIPWIHVLFDNNRSIDAPYDCQWISHEFWVPEEEFRAKKEYKHKDEVSAQTLRRFSPTQQTRRRTQLTTPADIGDSGQQKFVQLFEIWDKKAKKVYILSPGVTSGFIHEKDWPYKKLKDFPFSFLNFNPITDEPYGIPDVYTFERQLLELMKVDFQILDHVKKNNRQLITEPGNLSEESKLAFEEGQTGVLLEAKDPDKIFNVPYPSVQQDIYPLRNFLIQNINNTNGQPANQRGSTQPVATRTFRELAKIDEGSENRRTEQLDVLEDFMEDAARKLSELIDEFGDSEYFVKVSRNLTPEQAQAILDRPSGQDLENNGVSFNGDQISSFSTNRKDSGGIQSEFDVQIKTGSTVPLSRENKTEIFRFVLEAGPAAGAIPGGPLMGATVKSLFREFDLPELEMALDDEQEAQKQLREAQSQQVKEDRQFSASIKGAETEIDATREADRKENTRIKQEEVQLKRIELRIRELEAAFKATQNRDGFNKRKDPRKK